MPSVYYGLEGIIGINMYLQKFTNKFCHLLFYPMFRITLLALSRVAERQALIFSIIYVTFLKA